MSREELTIIARIKDDAQRELQHAAKRYAEEPTPGQFRWLLKRMTEYQMALNDCFETTAKAT